jgi:hypothetical protein
VPPMSHPRFEVMAAVSYICCFYVRQLALARLVPRALTSEHRLPNQMKGGIDDLLVDRLSACHRVLAGAGRSDGWRERRGRERSSTWA